jgi:predicted N-acetyltransferase YhbS
MVQIVPLSRIAPDAVEALLDDAFGSDRHGRTAYKLRDGMPAIDAMSFAAVDGDALIGSIQSWPIALTTADTMRHPLVLVGPVAVQPDLQRGGVGKMLMQAMLDAAPTAGVDAMTMIGDPEYYDRFFGFSNEATSGWQVPGPVEQRRLLAKITRPGGLPAQGMLGPDPAWLQKAIAA